MSALDEQYEAWNRALIDEYFPAGRIGRLAYLPLDDEELEAMAEPYELCATSDAVRDFTGAVRRELHKRGFAGFASVVSGWRRVRDAPPYVAALGFCVLAGSRMQPEAHAGIASSNYYTQLNRLLGLPDRAGQPKGFDRLGHAWEDLATWLTEDCSGARGSSTIRTSPDRKHVGYPISQCLLRAVDRRRLPDFFRIAGLTQTTDISAGRLFSLLKAWAAQPSCGLSSRARSAIANAVDVDLHEIAETVERELRAWDGELRDERGRRRAPIHLYVIPRGRRPGVVSLIARRPSGYPTGEWAIEGSPARVDLSEYHAEGWFAPLDILVNEKILQQGLRLVREDLALSFDPAEAVPCRQAEIAIGGYLSQPGSVMWEPHIAVARRAVADDLKAFLARHGDSKPPDLASAGLPSPWTLIGPYRLTSVPQDAPSRFARFAPRMFSTTSFDGGLRLSGPPPVYLTGGEPDVQVSVEPGHDLSVTLDGVEQTLRGGALELKLSQMALRPGEHELVADVTRRFATRETFGDVSPTGAGTLGHRLACHTDYRPDSNSAEHLSLGPAPRGWVYLSGALANADPEDLPLGDRRPLLIRAGLKQVHVIGAEGEVADAPEHPPAWLEPLKLADFVQFIELDPPFPPAFLLTKSGDGTRRIEPLTEQIPPPEPVDGASKWWAVLVKAWRDAEIPTQAASDWAAYLDAAVSASREASA